MSGPTRALKVSDLAGRTGVSVRTLHHYHEIGLLSPSGRSSAGHRLYTETDVERLLRIRALQSTGLALAEIGRCLDDPAASPARLLEQQARRVDEQIGALQRSRDRLERLRQKLVADGDVTVADFLEAIEEMTMFEKYYTPEQIDRLHARAAQVGEERIGAAQVEWPALIAAMRAEMQRGTDPADPEVQSLAGRWRELVEEFTGGDAGVRAGVQRLYEREPGARQRFDLDADLMSYVGRALGAPPGSA